MTSNGAPNFTAEEIGARSSLEFAQILYETQVSQFLRVTRVSSEGWVRVQDDPASGSLRFEKRRCSIDLSADGAEYAEEVIVPAPPLTAALMEDIFG